MASEWETVTVEEIAAPVPNALAMGPFGSNIKTDFFVSEGVPVIRGNNLNSDRFLDGDFVYLTWKKADELKNSNAFPGDLVFTHRGTLGQVGLIPQTARFKRYVVSQSQMKLTCDTTKMNPIFLFYYFRSPEGQHQILSYASTTGVPAIARPLTSLKAMEIPKPPLPEQKAIAHILSALDDKIELNRMMNQTLETMAQAIFKSWFVDFDPVKAKAQGRMPQGMDSETAALFPDSFQDSELGKIPKGWGVEKVASLGKVICGKTPPTENPENYGDFMPFVRIPDMNGKVFVTETVKSLSMVGAQSQSNNTLPAYSICVSCIATPGLVAITSEPSQTNQQINSVVPAQKDSSFYCYYTLRKLTEIIKSSGSGGSVFTNLSKARFTNLPILKVPKELQVFFHKTVRPFLDHILLYERQSRILASIRDTLLPKLISGQIRVKDAEKFLENSA